jgi:hypothetical protein
VKIFGKSIFVSTSSGSTTDGSAGSAPDTAIVVESLAAPDQKEAPTIEELKAQLYLVAQELKKLYGNRTAVIIAIGLPNGAHDRFAAYTTGPCLMERGLLHWAVPNLEQQMDAHVTETPGEPSAKKGQPNQ